MISRATFALVGFVALFGACSTPAPPPPAVTEALPPPPDQSAHFPQDGLVNMDRIPAHLLGKKFMPGGNLATYKRGRFEYQHFLGKMPDADHAAFLLLDWNKALQGSKYLAHMGGYFGMDGEKAIYVFVKGTWIAGIVGLPEDKADPIAREFAARL